MAKRVSKSRQNSQEDNRPRLGVVLRFPKGAGISAIKNLEASGLKVASSQDFKRAKSVPNNFDGAQIQYFEKLGLAVVRERSERLNQVVSRSLENKTVLSSRAERVYTMMGRQTALLRNQLARTAAVSSPDLSYLRGYRDGVAEIVRLAEGGPASNVFSHSQLADDHAHTWGLQATLVNQSSLSGRGIKVAILDTGLDDTHPDFAGRIITKKLFASKSVETDVDGHGTHCIGTACGSFSPVSGPRYGVAYEAEIFAGKVLGDDGFGTDRSILAGIDWALSQGCHIISMSLGAASAIGDQPSRDYEQVGQVCLDAGTLIVAAAGNESQRPNHIAPVGSPANASTIMAVGAVDSNLAIAGFSCGGMNPGQEVDIAAPGVAVRSSVPGGGYESWPGTSMATPHVAGVAALLAQSDQSMRGWTLWTRLLQLSRALDLPARDVGRGFLQAPV